MAVTLDGSSLSLDAVLRVAEKGEEVRLSPSSIRRMTRFRELLQNRIEHGEVVYGVNTGYGWLSDKEIPKKQIKQLQLNLVRSHAVGVGDYMPTVVVRAAMLIRLNSMLNGNSAIRSEIATLIAGMLNNKVTPCVPSFGSLGASGDLAPSAHMALVMIGEGKAFHENRLVGGRHALYRAKLEPVKLDGKEGLSLINGTCFTTALASITIHRARLLLDAANSSAALTAEVIGACAQSFDERLMDLRKLKSQGRVAARMRAMLKGSSRVRNNPVPQDPYSIRCVPQVHGSTEEALDFAERLVTDEMNSVTDNPILAEDGQIFHGGNFHAQPVAMALDLLSIAVAYLGTISLARVHLLMSNSPSSKKFGARHPGLESGLMVAEYTSSALAAENARDVYPSSIYPANVSAGIEDHASYGVNAGLKAMAVTENISKMIAIELVCASNMVRPFDKELSPYNSRMSSKIRSVSPLLTGDRSMSEELEALSNEILKGELSSSVEDS
jgi:histidine ammonia-lyase